MNQNLKVCIYGLGSYQLLTNKKQEYIGGAELQQMLLGAELSKKDINVSFIVFDYGQPAQEIVNGISIYKTIPKTYLVENGSLLPLLKTSIVNWLVLRKCNADIYYSRGSGKYTGLIAFFCMLHRKKYVIGMASDKDLNGVFERNASPYEKISFNIGLRLANSVICQSEIQKKMLKQKFKKKGIVIKNMHPFPPKKTLKKNMTNILWVATIKDTKQPDIYLEIARKLPNLDFKMIGGPLEIDYYEKIKHQCQKINNIDFVGFVPYPEINDYFDEASIFVNTSKGGAIEGFPNTFIQAWMRSIPTVTLDIDPDGIIKEYELGYNSKTINQMIEDIKNLAYNDELRIKIGENARNYAQNNFEIENITSSYIELFKNLV